MMYRRMNPKQLEKVIEEVINERNRTANNIEPKEGKKDVLSQERDGGGNSVDSMGLDRCLNGLGSSLVRLN